MDRLFDALASAPRRALLDALFAEEGQTLGQLCDGLEMTRQGASKHLALLEEAGLVAVRWKGREKLHFLNPIPIQQAAERWLAKYQGGRLAALSALQGALEAPKEVAMAEKGFLYQVVIAADPEAVWKALTQGEFTRQFWFGRTVVSDWQVGSEVKVVTPEGTNEVTGQVVAAEEPKVLAYTWNTGNPDTDGTTVRFEIQAMGPLVKLTVTQDLEMTSATAPQAAQGWTFILNGLKTLLETGKPMPALPWKK